MSKIVALPWYHRADWQTLHADFADRDAIPDSYDRWKSTAIAREAKWRQDGYNVQRVELKPEAFQTWCRARKRAGDHASRRAYVDEVLAQRRLAIETGAGGGLAGKPAK